MSWDWEKLKKDHEPKSNKPKPKKKKYPDWVVSVLVYGGSILVMIIVIALLWIPGRWISYKLKYETQVKKAVIEMVKPEALKDKYREKGLSGQPQNLK